MTSPAWEGSGHRAELAQAQWMVCAQAHCTMHAALAAMNDTARATDETLEAIAAAVVKGEISFDT
jgi:hypothetical protein